MGVATTTRRNKYGAKRTWSELCGRWFDSKAEAARGEELALLERAGEIAGLEYQPKWELCKRPRVTYAADFAYYPPQHLDHGEFRDCSSCTTYEDVKGILGRDTRVKLAWLREQYGVTVTLLRLTNGGFEPVPWAGKPARGRARTA